MGKGKTVKEKIFNRRDKNNSVPFFDYNEERIVVRNMELGWKKPDDTDPNSTNCLLNAYANHIHRKKYGFHPYVWEIANMVRAGVMTREEGSAKIEPPEDRDMVTYIRGRLDTPI